MAGTGEDARVRCCRPRHATSRCCDNTEVTIRSKFALCARVCARVAERIIASLARAPNAAQTGSVLKWSFSSKTTPLHDTLPSPPPSLRSARVLNYPSGRCLSAAVCTLPVGICAAKRLCWLVCGTKTAVASAIPLSDDHGMVGAGGAQVHPSSPRWKA